MDWTWFKGVCAAVLVSPCGWMVFWLLLYVIVLFFLEVEVGTTILQTRLNLLAWIWPQTIPHVPKISQTYPRNGLRWFREFGFAQDGAGASWSRGACSFSSFKVQPKIDHGPHTALNHENTLSIFKWYNSVWSQPALAVPFTGDKDSWSRRRRQRSSKDLQTRSTGPSEAYFGALLQISLRNWSDMLRRVERDTSIISKWRADSPFLTSTDCHTKRSEASCV